MHFILTKTYLDNRDSRSHISVWVQMNYRKVFSVFVPYFCFVKVKFFLVTKMKTLSTQTVPSQPIQQKNNSYMLCIPMLKNSKQKCIFKFKVTFWLITLFWSPYLLHLVVLMLIKNWNNLERAHMQPCSRGSVGKYKIIPKWFCLSKGYF